MIGGFVGRTLTPGGSARERMPRCRPGGRGRWRSRVVAFAVPLNAGDPVTRQLRPDRDRASTAERAVDRRPSRSTRPTPPTTPAGSTHHDWQGGSGTHSLVAQSSETGPGIYAITEPIPVDGTWKTTLRLHVGRRVLGLPIFLPADDGDPGRGGSRSPSAATREFILDKDNLQREQKDDVPGWLTSSPTSRLASSPSA